MTINEILQEHHITKAELGRMLSIPANTLFQWTTGKREPPEYLVALISYYLDHELGIPASRNEQAK